MVYKSNVPQPQDYLNIKSQPDLLGNFAQLDASFGIDHYPFSNLTANNGFHTKTTMPVYNPNPIPVPPNPTSPLLYAFQQTVPLGAQTFNRSWDLVNGVAGVPTPLTNRQSGANPITILPLTSVNILDFTGLTVVICRVYCFNANATLLAQSMFDIAVYWNGTTFQFVNAPPGFGLALAVTGNILQIRNQNGALQYNNVYWTIQFLRIQ